MPKNAKLISLEERAEALRRERGTSIAVDDIETVVGSLVSGDAPNDEVAAIASELKELLSFIVSAKAELEAMQPNSISKRDIPSAHDQLDAVITATEDAASAIMDAADAVGEIAEEVDEKNGDRLRDISTELFQASSFQDLTGQRITKVTTTLMHIESRLSSLAEAIGDQFVAPPEEDEVERDAEGVVIKDADLLHGPQLEGEGNSQDEIDALLASFD